MKEQVYFQSQFGPSQTLYILYTDSGIKFTYPIDNSMCKDEEAHLLDKGCLYKVITSCK